MKGVRIGILNFNIMSIKIRDGIKVDLYNFVKLLFGIRFIWYELKFLKLRRIYNWNNVDKINFIRNRMRECNKIRK